MSFARLEMVAIYSDLLAVKYKYEKPTIIIVIHRKFHEKDS